MTDDGVLHPVVRPIRDRTTLLAYAQLGLLGWFVYAFGASLTLLRDDEGLSRTAASLLSISLAAGGTLGSFLAASIVRRWGRGAMLRAGALAIATGTLLYISDGPLWLVATGPFIGSLGASFCAVGVSAYLEARQGAAADASLAEDPRFVAAMEDMPAERNGLLYIDLGLLLSALGPLTDSGELAFGTLGALAVVGWVDGDYPAATVFISIPEA